MKHAVIPQNNAIRTHTPANAHDMIRLCLPREHMEITWHSLEYRQSSVDTGVTWLSLQYQQSSADTGVIWFSLQYRQSSADTGVTWISLQSEINIWGQNKTVHKKMQNMSAVTLTD